MQPGWIRFPTDGTRLQVFDPSTGRIGKVHKNDMPYNTIPLEIKARSRASALAPAILEVASDQQAFSEEWMSGYNLHYSLDYLLKVIGKLRTHMYAVDYVDAVEYRNLITGGNINLGKWEPLLTRLLNEWPGKSLPLSQVHGDLVAANLWYHPVRGIVLLDWEYSRRCLVTQDCWFYIYHHYRSRDRENPLPNNFFNDFHDVLRRSGFGGLADRLSSIHPLHLIERLILLKAITPFEHFSLQMLEKDILEASRDRRIMLEDAT